MGCGASSVAQTISAYQDWPPRATPCEGCSFKLIGSPAPFVPDEAFVDKFLEDSRALTHLHASSSVVCEGQQTAHLYSKRDPVRCSSAWLSKAGLDSGAQKLNQDCALAIGTFQTQEQALFGVFDGHGPNGHHASQYARERFPRLLKRHLREHDAAGALQRAFADVQKGLERAAFSVEMSGTTAVVAHLEGLRLTAAWAGDSRAVLGRRTPSGGCAAVALTQDHKPDVRAEAARISAKGGRVERIHGQDGDDVGPLRVWMRDMWIPGLAMSRALGDGVARRAGVISQPEVCTVELSPADEVLVMGSDGLFELLTNQEIIDIVAGCPSAEDACQQVVARAHERWMEVEDDCSDDITAVVLRFKMPRRHAEPICSSPADVTMGAGPAS